MEKNCKTTTLIETKPLKYKMNASHGWSTEKSVLKCLQLRAHCVPAEPKSRLFIAETHSMLTDNELPCQKTDNYSPPIRVLHHGTLMEAAQIKFRYRRKQRRRTWPHKMYWRDSETDKNPLDSEIWLLMPNGIKLAHFVFALTRLPGFW